MKHLFTFMISALFVCAVPEILVAQSEGARGKLTLVNGAQGNVEYIITAPATKYPGNQLQGVPANDVCSNATLLTVGAGCITGTTRESNIEPGESSACLGTIDESVWYKFVATSTSMFVEVEENIASSDNCYLGSAVWSGSCLPTNNLSCENIAGGPALQIHKLTGLTIGSTYYVQVVYNLGGPCGTKSTNGADFCIRVGNTTNCSTCSNTCGAICVFGSPPTVNQVTSSCTAYPMNPRLRSGESTTQCYTFTANNDSLDLQMIVKSVGCPINGGNVTSFNWTLYASTCGAVLSSGTLANLTATGLTVGGNYVLCYNWTAACEHDTVWPYIVSTSFVLPVELLQFNAESYMNYVALSWSTASERNNKYFVIERSVAKGIFEAIGRIGGAGNSSIPLYYSFKDNHPIAGIAYYRLRQTDYDGQYAYSNVIAVNNNALDNIRISPNPVRNNLYININATSLELLAVTVTDMMGRRVFASNEYLANGFNRVPLDLTALAKGVYFLKIGYKSKEMAEVLIKE